MAAAALAAAAAAVSSAAATAPPLCRLGVRHRSRLRQLEGRDHSRTLHSRDREDHCSGCSGSVLHGRNRRVNLARARRGVVLVLVVVLEVGPQLTLCLLLGLLLGLLRLLRRHQGQREHGALLRFRLRQGEGGCGPGRSRRSAAGLNRRRRSVGRNRVGRNRVGRHRCRLCLGQASHCKQRAS